MPEIVKKPRPLDYAPPLTVRERVGRYLPSGDQFVNFLKNLLWVVPLTLLIWIYAEREQTVTLPTEPVSIDVRTNDHNRLVDLRFPQDKNIIVELSGPRARIDRLREMLQPNPEGGAAIQIYVDPQIGLGSQQLTTVSQINNLPVFKNNGITVKSAQPPFLSVFIDDYDKRMVPVRIPPDYASFFSDQTRFIPDMVEIRAPKTMIERAETANQLFVYPILPKREDLKNKTGTITVENVPVHWPDFRGDTQLATRRENVTYAPYAVTAKLDIKQRDAEYVIPSVPIVKETPGLFEKRFNVVYSDFIPNVAVVGPMEQIEAIKRGDRKVKARLEISSLDPKGPGQRQLQWELPEGVKLAPSMAEKANWKFSIEDRD
jgi:hypothetical protein